jgi:large subunit ribosomal protein L22
MGRRKREAAELRKEAMKSLAFARLNDCPSSPRKMRLVADLIRGKQVDQALNILKFSTKDASAKIEKLLLSAINNWQAKNESLRIEDQELFVDEVFVDGGRMLKRLRTAPQGRGYRIRKRSNHVTLVLGNKLQPVAAAPPAEEAETIEPEAVQTAEAEQAETAAPAPEKKKKGGKKPAGKKKKK